MDSPIFAIVLTLALFGFIGMMILRTLMLWYWKVNERLQTLQRIEQHLGELTEMQKEIILMERSKRRLLDAPQVTTSIAGQS